VAIRAAGDLTMKKLVLAGLVMTIGFGPALGFAQTKSDGSKIDPGTGGTSNPSTTNPPAPTPAPGAPTPPGTPAPAPSTGTQSPQQRLTTQADCERAGGKWSGASMKCEIVR
jgi:hypothetical protein